MRNAPFVGRESELHELGSLLDQPERGDRPIGIALVGDAGVGKTRLLTEFLDRAGHAGVDTTLVRANASARSVPLGCLGHLHATRPVPDRPLTSDVMYHEVVASLIARLAGSDRSILAVDDLSQLDDASAAAVHQCFVASGAVLVATIRSNEPRPSAFDALWRDGSMRLMTVRALSDHTMISLIDQALDGLVDIWSEQLLVELANGNPLTLRELLAAGIDTGALRVESGYWRLDGDFGAGTQVRALVAHRLARIEPVDRRAMELVALAEPCAYDALCILVDADQIDHLIERGLLTIDLTGAEPTLRCDHPLIGEVLRAELPPARRRRLASELVPLLPADAEGGPAFLRRAHLHLESGAPVDADLASLASVVARHIGDHRLADRLADATLEVADREGPTRAAGAQAALTRAVIHAIELGPDTQRRFADALGWADTDDQRQLVMNEWAWGAMLGSGLEAARAVLDVVDEQMTSLAGHLAAQACRATFLGYSGRWHAAQEELGHVIEMLGTDGDGGRSALCIRAMAAGFDGPVSEAVACAQQARELDAVITPLLHVSRDAGEVYGLSYLRGFAPAVSGARRLMAECLSGASYLDFAGMWAGIVSNIAVSMSVLDARTQRDIDDAVRLLRWRDPCALVSFAVASRGTTAALAGELGDAHRFLDEYDCDFRAVETKTTALADRGRAWLAHQEGDLDEAVAWADRAWAAAWEQTDCALWAAPAAHDLVRFGVPDRAIDRLDAAADRLQAPFSNALADHARALANADVDALCVVGETFAQFGANALGAEALAQAAELGAAADRPEFLGHAVVLLGDSLIRTPLTTSLVRVAALLPTRREAHKTSGRIGNLLAPTEPAGLIDSSNASEPVQVLIGREGQKWRITFEASSVLVRDLAGMGYLATLIANPHHPIRAVKLAGGADLPGAAAQPILDAEARRQIERRGRNIASRLARARDAGRQTEVEQLEEEVEQLTSELERNRQLNGVSRSFADPDERARTSVRKAIVRALDEIDSVLPEAARFLRTAITTGTSCRYEPARVSSGKPAHAE